MALHMADMEKPSGQRGAICKTPPPPFGKLAITMFSDIVTCKRCLKIMERLPEKASN